MSRLLDNILTIIVGVLMTVLLVIVAAIPNALIVALFTSLVIATDAGLHAQIGLGWVVGVLWRAYLFSLVFNIGHWLLWRKVQSDDL